ncbi:50S ribosomal protein L24 [bacterium]|nr:50S ribosomal protein L24 [bacterium]
MKIKKGDTVLIITGKYKGRKGKVIQVHPKLGRITVEGINLAKKHQKPKREGEKGQIVEIPKPIDVSNAKLICPKCRKATRVGYRVVEGIKYRICKKCNQEI